MIRRVYNQTNSDCLIVDIGICILANDSYDFSEWDLDEVLRSNDLFDWIEDKTLYLDADGVIVESGEIAKKYFTPVTEFCGEAVKMQNILTGNLSENEEFIVANLLNIIFKTHIEEIYMRENLKNVFVSLCNEYWLLEEIENIALVSGKAILVPQGWTKVLDAHNRGLPNLDKYETLHEVNISESGEQIIVDIEEGCPGEEVVFTMAPKIKNWKKYNYVYCDIESVEGIEVSFIFEGDRLPLSGVNLANGINRVYFDISSVRKSGVKKYGFCIKMKKDVEPCTIKIGALTGIKASGFYETGYLKTRTIELENDISEVFICNNWSLDSPFSIVMDVSVDGGLTWRRINHGAFNNWISVSDWSTIAKNRLKIKFSWDSSETGISAALDDYFVMYRI